MNWNYRIVNATTENGGDDLIALADRATWTSQKKHEHDLKLKKEQA